MEYRAALGVFILLASLVVGYIFYSTTFLLISTLFAVHIISKKGQGLMAEPGAKVMVGLAATMVGLALLVAPFSLLLNASNPLNFAMLTWACCIAVPLALRCSMEYERASTLLLMSFQSIIVIYLAFSGLHGLPLENFVDGFSSNGFTSFLVILQANYLLTRRGRFLLEDVLFCGSTVWICVIGYGRGSLIAALALFLICFLSYVPGNKGSRFAAVYRVALLVGCLLVVGTWWDKVSYYVYSRTKLSHGLVDPHRAEINRSYIASLDWTEYFIGGDYEGTKILSSYHKNPHNSFIRAHHNFGLLYVVVVLVSPLVMLWGHHPLGDRLRAVLIAYVVMFRAATEPILFPTPLDVVFLTGVGVFYKRGQSSSATGQPAYVSPYALAQS